MLDGFYEYINDNKLIQEGDKIVVGVSGGADSVALFYNLLELMQKIPFSIYCVHVNHGIRGEEAKRDEEYVRKLCKENNISISVYEYDVNEYANKHRLSSEEAGRLLRYESFNKELSKQAANKIAVAHNANDQAETIMLNIFRGTGLTGLVGIQASRGNIIRPLLKKSREQIEQYLQERDISFMIDRTNLGDEYTRNKIRHNVLPYVVDNINARAIEHINNTAELLSVEEAFIEEQTDIAYSLCADNREEAYYISIEKLLEVHTAIQRRIIRRVIGNIANRLKDIDMSHIDIVLELIDKQVGRQINLPYDIIVIKDYKQLKFIRKTQIIERKEICEELKNGLSITSILGEANITIRQMDCEKNVNIPKKSYTKWLDYDRIKGKLQIRTRQPGDYIQIKGINGRKKLSDFFVDNKIPKERRDGILLLTEGQEVLWIIGYRISERYKVSGTTLHILEMAVEGTYTEHLLVEDN